MDIKLQEITFPTLLWYIIPGLNFLLFDIFVPIIISNPMALGLVNSFNGIIFAALLALLIGFVMDSAKIYQYTIGYRKRNNQFFEDTSKKIPISPQELRTFFESIKVGLNDKNSFGRAVAFEHSRWVMINHTSKCFFLLALIWILLWTSSIYRDQDLNYLFQLKMENSVLGSILNFTFILLSIFFGFRLRNISIKIQTQNAQRYMILIEKYKDEILNLNY